MAASSPTSSHHLRLQCIYFDDLLAAVRQCHENFILVQSSLAGLNKQLRLRCSDAEAKHLLKTQHGLVKESVLQLETAMREVLGAVEEHFAEEVKRPGSGSQDRLWTLTEEILSQPGRSGSALLASLAAVVAEERQSLEQFQQSYSLEADFQDFQLKNNQEENSPRNQQLEGIISGAQKSHVRHFLRSKQLERESSALTQEVSRLTEAHLKSLEKDHGRKQSRGKAAKEDEASARERREDWSLALEERLDLVALEAEAQCLERLRRKYQEEAEAALKTQDEAAEQRSSVQVQRAAVRANQETIGRLSRRNRDARRRLTDTRSEAQPLASACRSGLDSGAQALLQCGARLETATCASPLASPRSGPQKGATGVLCPEASVARLARQVVSESGGGRGATDFGRLLANLRSKCQSMDGLLAADEKAAGSSLSLKQPLVQINKEALQRLTQEECAVEAAVRERKEAPKLLCELLSAKVDN